MSLILDALKKAQQLRTEENPEILSFNHHPVKKQSLRKRRWLWFGLTFIGLLTISFLLRETISLPKKESIDPAPGIRFESPEIEVKPEGFDSVIEESPASSLDSLGKGPLLKESPPVGIQPKPLQGKKEKIQIVLKAREEYEFSGLASSIQNPLEKETKPSAQSPPIKESSNSLTLEEEKRTPPPIEIREERGKDGGINPEALHQFNLGVMFYRKGETSKAIEAYRKAISLNPEYVEAYNNLGIIYQETGNREEALTCYQRAIEINPQYEKGLNNLGLLYVLKGDLKKAQETFQKILTMNPYHLESYLHLGMIWKKEGQLEKAKESYGKALSLNPLHGETHYHLGLLYEEMGKIDLAFIHYQTFINLSASTYPELALRVKRHLGRMTHFKSSSPH